MTHPVAFYIISCLASFSQNVQNVGTLPQGTSPPKPPRAHELKLLVKDIMATLMDPSAAGETVTLMQQVFCFKATRRALLTKKS